MRWVFVGIVALNLLYLGWRLTGGGDIVPLPARPAVEASNFPNSLVLLSERPGVALPAQSTTQPAAPRLAGCPAIGPVSDTADASRIIESLKQAGYAAAQSRVDLRGTPSYWVFIPPYPTKALAQRQIRELHSRGVDSFIVTDGTDANAISLGTFVSKDSARGVQSRMRAAGYPAEIREQLKDVTQSWVVLREPGAQGFLERIPRDLAGSLRTQRVPCAR